MGKTTLCALLADHLARRGADVVLVDADSALSLGQACGLPRAALPVALSAREDLIRERIGAGIMSLTPAVDDLPAELSVPVPLSGPAAPGATAGSMRLLVMDAVTSVGGGCACAANALLKALLARLMTGPEDWVLVDLEAGVEHLGRGTVADVDGLIVVSEPSWRGLETAAEVGRLARDLGLENQVLVLNRAADGVAPPDLPGLPRHHLGLPQLAGLAARQLADPSVLGLPETAAIDAFCERLLTFLKTINKQPHNN